MSSERVGLMSAMVYSRQILCGVLGILLLPFKVSVPQFRADSRQFALLEHGEEIPANVQSFIDRSVFLFSLAHKLVFEFLCELQQFLVSYAQCVFSNNGNKSSEINTFCIVCVHL